MSTPDTSKTTPATPKPADKPAPATGASAENANGESKCEVKNVLKIVSAVVLGAAVIIPVLAIVCGGSKEEEEEEEQEKKVASGGGAVLSKLVAWVKEITDGEEGDEGKGDENNGDSKSSYAEVGSVADFAATQSQ